MQKMNLKNFNFEFFVTVSVGFLKIYPAKEVSSANLLNLPESPEPLSGRKGTFLLRFPTFSTGINRVQGFLPFPRYFWGKVEKKYILNHAEGTNMLHRPLQGLFSLSYDYFPIKITVFLLLFLPSFQCKVRYMGKWWWMPSPPIFPFMHPSASFSSFFLSLVPDTVFLKKKRR